MQRPSLTVISVLYSLLLSGCGLVLQGRYQTINITSVPPGATASRVGQNITTPGQYVVRRRRDVSVVRVTKAGYRSGCALLTWKRATALVVFDSMPLGLPLLIDLIAGTMPGQFQTEAQVVLEPLPPDFTDVLPPDEVVLDAALNRRLDFCQPPPDLKEWMDMRSRYAKRAAKVAASVGPVSQPYTVLGDVNVRARGASWFAWNYMDWGPMATFSFRRYRYKEDPSAVNEMLKVKALAMYGESVDAVVNIHYEQMPGYDTSATGVAVHFNR
jgi:hypothetical protein